MKYFCIFYYYLVFLLMYRNLIKSKFTFDALKNIEYLLAKIKSKL